MDRGVNQVHSINRQPGLMIEWQWCNTDAYITTHYTINAWFQDKGLKAIYDNTTQES